VTALAFDYFASQQVDIAVIETGLGGRLDATNVLTPEVAVITDISRDHAEILGDTIELIASEKAGIIKTGIPTVTGLLPKEASRVIGDVCRERRSPRTSLQRRDFRPDGSGLRMDYCGDGLSLRGFVPSLIGPHQLRNCALVLKTIGVLKAGGVQLSKQAVVLGLKSTDWPGRFQVIDRNGSMPRVVLDVCHNAAGARAFADTFARWSGGRKAAIVIGLVKRKEHQAIIDALSAVAASFHLVPLASKRSVDVRDLVAHLRWHGIAVTRSGRLDTALGRLLKTSTLDDTICVIGSHYLVGEYLAKYVWK
jgi:dihydrofolate synthase / folylpolyglutamate synthase